ncbi:MAG: hypothetical protein HY332_10765 [Chloroflexi bacterium]|nr:hypothetical protein [Chloroflexota bacterium]
MEPSRQLTHGQTHQRRGRPNCFALAQFLEGPYRARAAGTREHCLGALLRLDHYLARQTPVGGGQWSLVTPDHLHAYLAEGNRLRLERARQFFVWAAERKRTARLHAALPKPPDTLRVRLLSREELQALYDSWTGPAADPLRALVGLLVLVHWLDPGEIRHLRLTDVLAPDRLRVRGTRGRPDRVVELQPEVARALANYLASRAASYSGPSTYLLANPSNRLHDRPVWYLGLMGPKERRVTAGSLKQSAFRDLLEQGADLVQIMAFTRLTPQAAAAYLQRVGYPTGCRRDQAT